MNGDFKKLCILCPGQGAQVVGMGKDLHSTYDAARGVYQEANQILGFDLASICFEGPEDRLNRTDISQPAIYVTSVACFHAAIAREIIDPSWQYQIYAGLSLGEYTALHLAGVFSFEDGLKLVAARGRFMQEAAEAARGGMVAVLGADESAVEALCKQAAQGEILVPANFNAPGQIIVSGAFSACERLIEAAGVAGFKPVALKVAGAFHSELMRSAADKLRAELDTVRFHRLVSMNQVEKVTVYSNVTAAPHLDTASIKRLLVDQLVSPVRWEQTMRQLVADPENSFIELAPGRTLTGMAKRLNRRLAVQTLDSVEAFSTAKV